MVEPRSHIDSHQNPYELSWTRLCSIRWFPVRANPESGTTSHGVLSPGFALAKIPPSFRSLTWTPMNALVISQFLTIISPETQISRAEFPCWSLYIHWLLDPPTGGQTSLVDAKGNTPPPSMAMPLITTPWARINRSAPFWSKLIRESTCASAHVLGKTWTLSFHTILGLLMAVG